MRITQGMLSTNMLRNLSTSYERMGKYQDQLSTGKKINRPSEDPVIAMKGISYRRDLSQTEQYKANFSEAYNWIENSDAALDKATQAMQRIRELVVQASNDTYDTSQRGSIATEIDQLKEHLITIANTQVGDKYIFNGTKTLDAPIGADDKPNSTSGTEVQIELSKGIYMPVSIKTDAVFTYDAANPEKGLFSTLEKLSADLKDSTKTNTDINKYLGALDTHINSMLNTRAELGARQNRIEMMEDRVDEQEVIAQRIVSDNEDADIERVITDLKTQESVHRAALGVGSRIIQPTLMDFLR
ncbi:flagellar hook-associated protein FlgL [Priestia koreensis]|uniref:flagellar hook-associated protein FlgL n=1 Tax=Priestia koreensis TaxID=284581 RepID=UPI001F5AD9BA|nr:flagellar hook-associated protein FlgL [Priestia koreensis]UNL84787.1 flagellar hook-associated protein FlgL [Priestia koreensis]